jgi:glycosyltransferase involved in cell wall biosynthesis
VYAAIGLPERLERLRNERMRRLYASALGTAAAVVAYSDHEANVLRDWLVRYGQTTRVEFVRFGVDTVAFAPMEVSPSVDVVSMGADPHRDYELLLDVADAMSHVRFLLVMDGDHARALRAPPANVEVRVDVPFAEVRSLLAAARVAALPVRDNSYSGATTVLLQSLAMGKPVVVTRTRAIATGYGLVDGENCRLVAPGDAAGFASALADVLGNESQARALGVRARETAARELTWNRLVDTLEGLLMRASGSEPSPGVS